MRHSIFSFAADIFTHCARTDRSFPSSVQWVHHTTLLAAFIITFLSSIQVTETVSQFPLLLVISFDGFRSDYVDLVSVPNLQKIMRKGVRAEWMQSSFITKTFPNHFSISTGFYEETHGIVANEMFDPIFNETFEYTDPKWWGMNDDVVPIWVLNQLSDPKRYSGGMMWPGTDVKIHNQTAYYYTNYNVSIPWTERVDVVVSWFTDKERPANLVMLYFEEPDMTGHRFGPNSIQIKKQIARVDRIVGYLVEKLTSEGLFHKMNIIILSDHGMAEVKNTIEMNSLINSSLYSEFGSSPVWHILPKEGHEQEVFDILMEASSHHNFTVYKKSEIPKIYHYKENRRIMPIIVVADEGWDLALEKPNRTTLHPWGNHGYNNSISSMHAFFLAQGPAFRKNIVGSPFANVNVFPLMCHVLKIKAPSTNGSIGALWYMLKEYAPYEIHFESPWLLATLSLLTLSFLGGVVGVVVSTIVQKQRMMAKEQDMIPLTRLNRCAEKNEGKVEEQQHLLLEDTTEE